MSDDLIFFTNPKSRGRIVRWMLEEVGCDYRTEIVDYGPNMKTGAYAEINPMGKIPALQHRGTVVTETAAICTYLADAFPEAGLAPALQERGDYYRWLFFAAGPFETAVTERAMGFEPPEDKKVMSGYGTMETTLNTIDGALDGKDFIAAGQFTAADVYFGSLIGWGMQFETIEKRPNFIRYFGQLMERDGFQRALKIDDEADAATTG